MPNWSCVALVSRCLSGRRVQKELKLSYWMTRDKTDVPEARAAKPVLHAPNRDMSFRLVRLGTDV
ncbi:hypothetical protein N7475_009760 [Penicillium sp. IBT 31633x]|nr:hypothetical protein N7475_009760 [Penicillium sp. IBT 31633x]